MAGHSHFKNIKRKKEAEDKKRGKIFSKISRIIISAVRIGGKDPKSNPTLRTAIEKAKEVDMPGKNIENAIKRGAGEGEEGKLEYYMFEVYGPDETAFIIEGYTDNKNRNLEEIREILKKNNAKLADPGSVTWLFDKKGIIEIEEVEMSEEITLEAIEKGLEDFEKKDDIIFIYTDIDNINNVKKFLEDKNIKVSSSYIGWKPKNKVNPSKDSFLNLLEDFQNNESIENIFTNI